MGEPFIGEIILFAGNFAPRAWAFCNGQLMSIAQNTALFSILGTTYGGDGRSTFALPDLRGRIPIHAGTGPGLTTRRLGARFGTEDNTLTILNLANHHHQSVFGSNAVATIDTPAYTDAGESSDPTNQILAQPDISGDNFLYSAEQPDTNLRTFSAPLFGHVDIGLEGHNSAINNMEPALVVNYIICMQGIYPSRS